MTEREKFINEVIDIKIGLLAVLLGPAAALYAVKQLTEASGADIGFAHEEYEGIAEGLEFGVDAAVAGGAILATFLVALAGAKLMTGQYKNKK